MVQPDICIVFGKNVRRIRRAKDMSQETLADLANVHRTYISGIERGSGRNPTIRAAAQIAVALEVPVAALFEDLPPATTPK